MLRKVNSVRETEGSLKSVKISTIDFSTRPPYQTLRQTCNGYTVSLTIATVTSPLTTRKHWALSRMTTASMDHWVRLVDNAFIRGRPKITWKFYWGGRANRHGEFHCVPDKKLHDGQVGGAGRPMDRASHHVEERARLCVAAHWVAISSICSDSNNVLKIDKFYQFIHIKMFYFCPPLNIA